MSPQQAADEGSKDVATDKLQGPAPPEHIQKKIARKVAFLDSEFRVLSKQISSVSVAPGAEIAVWLRELFNSKTAHVCPSSRQQGYLLVLTENEKLSE